MLEHCERSYDNKVESLSTHLKEREERIQRIIDCLVEESTRGTPIIVEGKKDIKTLRTLGVKGAILSAKTGGKSRLDIVSEVQGTRTNDVVLLLDFDRRGREWTCFLKAQLEKAKVKPDLTFWNQLHRFAGKDLKDIEGLATYLENMKKKQVSKYGRGAV
jgi:5S rRNA maturation endonuclease (ribonuclease M5)